MTFFDPRKPETWQYATDKPLVINGTVIYEEYKQGDNTVKKPKTSI
jgi:hypothetical protein